ADALRLGDQAEQRAVTIEAPRAALLHQVKPGLIVAIEQLVCHLAGGRLVGDLQCLGAEPLDADDRDEGVGEDATDGGVGLESFKLHHATRPVAVAPIGTCRASCKEPLRSFRASGRSYAVETPGKMTRGWPGQRVVRAAQPHEVRPGARARTSRRFATR